MRLRRFAFVLGTLLGFPAAAPAGPIAFTYTATGSPVLYPGEPYLNELSFALTPEGTVRWSGPRGALELGTVEFRPSAGPTEADSYTAYTYFDVAVTVTDGATGRSDALVLSSTAVDDWMHRSWDGRWLNMAHNLDFGREEGQNVNSTSTTIGGTRYTLSVRPENDNQVGVYTLSATALTPEPGTFLLAALGLAPLGLRRLRRGGQVASPALCSTTSTSNG